MSLLCCRLVSQILGEEAEDRLVDVCLEEMDTAHICSVTFEDFLTFFGVSSVSSIMVQCLPQINAKFTGCCWCCCSCCCVCVCLCVCVCVCVWVCVCVCVCVCTGLPRHATRNAKAREDADLCRPLVP